METESQNILKLEKNRKKFRAPKKYQENADAEENPEKILETPKKFKKNQGSEKNLEKILQKNSKNSETRESLEILESFSLKEFQAKIIFLKSEEFGKADELPMIYSFLVVFLA